MKNLLLLGILFFQTPIFATCLAIQTDKIFDGKKIINASDTYLIVKDNHIKAVRTNIVPNKCITIIIKYGTIIPGLIDSHSLIFATDNTFGTDFAKGLLANTFQSDIERTGNAKNKLKKYIAAGFTSIRDLGNSGRYLDVLLRNIASRSSFPRMFVSGPGITSIGGQFTNQKNSIIAREYDQLKNKSQIKSLLDKRIKNSVNLIKAYSDNDPNPNHMSLKLLSKLVSDSKKKGFKVAIHATDNKSISRAIKAGPTSIQHGYKATFSQLKEMKKKNIFLVPTDRGQLIYSKILSKLPKNLIDSFKYINIRDMAQSRKRFKNAILAKTLIAFGSDFYLDIDMFNIPFIDGVRSSLYSMVDYGLSPLGALTAATYNSANLLGRSDLGRIKINAKADLCIVLGEIDKDIKNIERIVLVIKNGKILIDNRTELNIK